MGQWALRLAYEIQRHFFCRHFLPFWNNDTNLSSYAYNFPFGSCTILWHHEMYKSIDIYKML